jgi:hypothetical protein
MTRPPGTGGIWVPDTLITAVGAAACVVCLWWIGREDPLAESVTADPALARSMTADTAVTGAALTGAALTGTALTGTALTGTALTGATLAVSADGDAAAEFAAAEVPAAEVPAVEFATAWPAEPEADGVVLADVSAHVPQRSVEAGAARAPEQGLAWDPWRPSPAAPASGEQ